jgi:hypothetical protein
LPDLVKSVRIELESSLISKILPKKKGLNYYFELNLELDSKFHLYVKLKPKTILFLFFENFKLKLEGLQRKKKKKGNNHPTLVYEG